MALNFSHRPVFAPHVWEDDMIRLGNGGGDVGTTSCSDYGGDNTIWGDYGRSQETVVSSNDISDLLPSDPFGMMDMSATFTALTGWLEDLEIDCNRYGMGDAGIGTTSIADYQWRAGWNFIWNNAMGLGFQSFPRKNIWMSDNSYTWIRYDVSSSPSSSIDDRCVTGLSYQNHEALPFALGYLGLRDLLATSSVCRYLRSTVLGDPLLWRTIHIDQPLNQKITDDALLELSRRAQGNLRSLSLVNCLKITEGCLKQVLDHNPRLTKLCVHGCTKIGVAIVDTLKSFNSAKDRGIKHLRIGGLFGITKEHLEELMMLLGINSQVQNNAQRQTFYHNKNLHLPYDDNRVLDIEMCPKCENVRVVYDCPGDKCQDKLLGDADKVCRACIHCIPRCFQCGYCINDKEHEENFSLDMICLNCVPKEDIENALVNFLIMLLDSLVPNYACTLYFAEHHTLISALRRSSVSGSIEEWRSEGNGRHKY